MNTQYQAQWDPVIAWTWTANWSWCRSFPTSQTPSVIQGQFLPCCAWAPSWYSHLSNLSIWAISLEHFRHWPCFWFLSVLWDTPGEQFLRLFLTLCFLTLKPDGNCLSCPVFIAQLHLATRSNLSGGNEAWKPGRHQTWDAHKQISYSLPTTHCKFKLLMIQRDFPPNLDYSTGPVSLVFTWWFDLPFIKKTFNALVGLMGIILGWQQGLAKIDQVQWQIS